LAWRWWRVDGLRPSRIYVSGGCAYGSDTVCVLLDYKGLYPHSQTLHIIQIHRSDTYSEDRRDHNRQAEVPHRDHRYELRHNEEITAPNLNAYLDFDSVRYLRLLCRRGFLVPVGEKGTKSGGYARSENWPPPASFFSSGPIGLTYYLQTWFRYYLAEWIDGRMSELEAREGVYSLENGFRLSIQVHDSPESSGWVANTPDSGGAFTASLLGDVAAGRMICLEVRTVLRACRPVLKGPAARWHHKTL